MQDPMQDHQPLVLLTEHEREQLIKALFAGQETVTEEDAQEVILWASTQLIGAALVRMAIQGRIALQRKDGEVYGCTPHGPSR